jgi:nitrogen fixation NifU-like protein
MSDLRDLYQEVILDHQRRPRNFGAPAHADAEMKGHNPLCGDRITVYVVMDASGDGSQKVKSVHFDGAGCAISTASASLMAEAVASMPATEVEALHTRVHAMLTSDEEVDLDDESMGKLTVLAGVREFPVRVKCATLAWHTLIAALHTATGTTAPAAVSTE